MTALRITLYVWGVATFIAFIFFGMSSTQAMQRTAGRLLIARNTLRGPPAQDQRGVDLISDGVTFGRCGYGKPNAVSNAIGCAKVLQETKQVKTMIMKGLSAGIAILLVGCTLERKGDLEGEVFIVTRGGENYKLGLVPITLYSLDSLKPYLEQKKQQAETEFARLGRLVDPAKSEMNAKEKARDAAFQAFLNAGNSDPNRSSLEAAYHQAKGQCELVVRAYHFLLDAQSKLVSGAFYFDGLPEPLATTQTNSDGKFTIEIPAKGNFVIAARADHTIGNSTEHYYWLIKVSLDGAAKKAIMLSNNNLSSEGSSDSLITTSKPKHDDYEPKERTR